MNKEIGTNLAFTIVAIPFICFLCIIVKSCPDITGESTKKEYIKAGYEQRVDPGTRQVYWVKPENVISENGSEE